MLFQFYSIVLFEGQRSWRPQLYQVLWFELPPGDGLSWVAETISFRIESCNLKEQRRSELWKLLSICQKSVILLLKSALQLCQVMTSLLTLLNLLNFPLWSSLMFTSFLSGKFCFYVFFPHCVVIFVSLFCFVFFFLSSFHSLSLNNHNPELEIC